MISCSGFLLEDSDLFSYASEFFASLLFKFLIRSEVAIPLAKTNKPPTTIKFHALFVISVMSNKSDRYARNNQLLKKRHMAIRKISSHLFFKNNCTKKGVANNKIMNEFPVVLSPVLLL